MKEHQLFDYENSEQKENIESQSAKPEVNVFLKIVQIILSIILGAMHV